METWQIILQSVFVGAPFLVAHFAVSILMFLLGVWLYILFTPMDEFKLIKEGNIAASISLSGACLGISIPIASCLASSINLIDILIWSSIALIIQLFCFKLVDIILKDLPTRIKDGEISVAILLLAFKSTIGIINGAAIYG